MRVVYSARSHTGYVRRGNEDNLYVGGFSLPPGAESRPFALDGVISGPTVLAVCDGMGGEENGAMASRTAVETLHTYCGSLSGADPEEQPSIVDCYVRQVQETIQSQNPAKRVGTTLALAVAGQRGTFCYNLGDTRIYRMQHGLLRQVTRDHTLGEQQRRRGRPPEALAGGKDPDQVLTRCIGIGSVQSPEAYLPIQGSCRLLLCSDGLTRMVDEQSLSRCLAGSTTPAQAVDSLMSLALKMGGRDNITAVVADLQTGFQALIGGFRSRRRRTHP